MHHGGMKIHILELHQTFIIGVVLARGSLVTEPSHDAHIVEEMSR